MEDTRSKIAEYEARLSKIEAVDPLHPNIAPLLNIIASLRQKELGETQGN